MTYTAVTPAIAEDYVPEIWANVSLPYLRAAVVMASRVATDAEFSTQSVGDTINVPFPGTFTANEKAANDEYTMQTPANAATVPVVLNTQAEVTFSLPDITRAFQNQNLMEQYGQGAAIAIAEKIEAAILTAAVAASNSIGTYGVALDAADFAAAWKALTDLKCPQDQRFAVISTKDYASCLTDTNLKELIAFNRPTAVSQANLGPLYGFDTFASQLAPSSSTSILTSTKNVFWRRDGLVLAMRPLPDPPASSGAVARTVIDPESGLQLRVLMGYDIRRGAVQVTYDCLFGVKLVTEEKVLLVKS